MHLYLDDDRLILDSPATPRLLALLPALEGHRRWLKEGGLRVDNTASNLRTLSALDGLTIVDRRAGAGAPVAPRRRAPGDSAARSGDPSPGAGYTSRTAPMPHQGEAREAWGDRPTFALFMEQGTGKTKVAIDIAGEWFASEAIDAVLVITKKGVHRQWIEGEFPKHYGGEFDGAFWPNTFPEKREFSKRLEVFAINYDALKFKRGIEAAWTLCQRHKGRLFIIADESQEIMNVHSARWKAADKIKQFSSHRALLTGTPIATDLMNEWAQLRWLDEDIIGIRYQSTFQKQFCNMGGFQNRSVVSHKNVAAFRKMVDPFTFRVTKEQIGILPKQYADWNFDLTPAQRKHIVEIKRDLRTMLDSGDDVRVDNVAVAMMKAQAISNGFVINDDETIRLMPIAENPRVQAALEWLDANPGKVIIWARFREDIAILSEAMREADIDFVSYHGGTKDRDREAAKASFNSRTGARVFLGNAAAAGTGLNLQESGCNFGLYYSNSFKAIDRWQSEDRIDRIGAVGFRTFTDLMGKGGPDRSIKNNLMRKAGIAEMALGDVRLIAEQFLME